MLIPGFMRRVRGFTVLSLALAALYVVVVAILSVVLFTPLHGNDFDQDSWPAAQEVVRGHPLQIYAPSTRSPHAPSSLDQGPVSILPLALVDGVISVAGPPDLSRRRAAGVALTAAFTLLMGREAVRLVDQVRGERSGRGRRLGIVAALAIPAAAFAIIFTHVELPLGMWFYLLSLRDLARGHLVRSALLAALAALTRSTVAILVLPLALFVAAQWGVRRASGWVGLVGALVIVSMAPFVIADPTGVRTAFIDVRAAEPVVYGSALALFAGTKVIPFARHTDGLFIMAGLLAVMWRLRRVIAQVPIGRPEPFAVLTAAALCFPLLGKATYAYHLSEAGVLSVVWWASLRRCRGAAMVVCLLVMSATATEFLFVIGPPPHDAAARASVVVATLMLLAMGMLIRDGRSVPVADPRGPGTSGGREIRYGRR